MASLNQSPSLQVTTLETPVDKSAVTMSVRPITPHSDSTNSILRRSSSQRKHKHNDYSCYIYISNTSDVDFQLVKSEAISGRFASGSPPSVIEAHSNVVIELTDPKGPHGSEGSCTYRLYHPQKSSAITFNLKFADPYWARDDNVLMANSHYPKHVSLNVLDYQAKGHPFIAHVEIQTLEVVGIDRKISHRSQRSVNTTRSSLTAYSDESEKAVIGITPLTSSSKEPIQTVRPVEIENDSQYRVHSKKDSAVGLTDDVQIHDLSKNGDETKQHQVETESSQLSESQIQQPVEDLVQSQQEKSDVEKLPLVESRKEADDESRVSSEGFVENLSKSSSEAVPNVEDKAQADQQPKIDSIDEEHRDAEQKTEPVGRTEPQVKTEAGAEPKILVEDVPEIIVTHDAEQPTREMSTNTTEPKHEIVPTKPAEDLHIAEPVTEGKVPTDVSNKLEGEQDLVHETVPDHVNDTKNKNEKTEPGSKLRSIPSTQIQADATAPSVHIEQTAKSVQTTSLSDESLDKSESAPTLASKKTIPNRTITHIESPTQYTIMYIPPTITEQPEPEDEDSFSSCPPCSSSASEPISDSEADELERQLILTNEPKYASFSSPSSRALAKPTPSGLAASWRSLFASRNTHLGIVAMIFLTSWGYTATKVSGGLLLRFAVLGSRRR